MSHVVEFFRDPETRIDLQHITGEEFQERFAEYLHLYARRGDLTVYAACRTTRNDLMNAVINEFEEGSLFEGHEQSEFMDVHGPQYMRQAFQESRRLSKS